MSARILPGRRRAQATICGRCGAATITGPDDDRAALVAAVDPDILTRTGELLAVIAGWATYEHDRDGGLWRRDPRRLRSTAAEHVHPSHRCSLPIPAAWTAPTTPTTAVTQRDVPGF